jgi:cytochrome c-type biogenesis protein CcmH
MAMWLVQTIATSAIAVFLCLLLVRRLERPRMEVPDAIEAWLDQLTKIERDLRQGLIDDAAADAARLEVKKRALESGREPRLVPKLPTGGLEFALVCAAGIVVAAAAGFYATTTGGDASTMSVPTAGQKALASFAEDAPAVKRLAAVTQGAGSESWWQPQSQQQPGLPSVEEMIQRLAARLEKNPKDGEGWRTLGWSYLNLGRFSEASGAYARAIELNPGDTELKTSRIDAVIRSSEGRVTTDAGNAIEDVLKVDPQNARALFFKGLAKAQTGDKASALADWVGLLKNVKPEEPWLPELKSRISELERDLGVDAPTLAAPKPAMSRDVAAASKNESGTPIEKGPNAQDLQSAKAMSPADRSAMIRDMVDGLARRLEQSPRDADGWIKLIRSRIVLGEIEQARRAFSRSIEVFTDEPQQRDRIVAAARQLGLNE